MPVGISGCRICSPFEETSAWLTQQPGNIIVTSVPLLTNTISTLQCRSHAGAAASAQSRDARKNRARLGVGLGLGGCLSMDISLGTCPWLPVGVWTWMQWMSACPYSCVVPAVPCVLTAPCLENGPTTVPPTIRGPFKNAEACCKRRHREGFQQCKRPVAAAVASAFIATAFSVAGLVAMAVQPPPPPSRHAYPVGDINVYKHLGVDPLFQILAYFRRIRRKTFF